MNKWVLYGLLILGGVVAADRLRALPGIKSLPRL